jgi:hypothetical protein
MDIIMDNVLILGFLDDMNPNFSNRKETYNCVTSFFLLLSHAENFTSNKQWFLCLAFRV